MRDKGFAIEEKVAEYLMAHGCDIIDRNVRSRFGEIDLIVMDNETMVFVEVRYRQSNAFGGAVGSITHAKQQRIAQTATQYLVSCRKYDKIPCRFDIVAVDETGLQWLKNAFTE